MPGETLPVAMETAHLYSMVTPGNTDRHKNYKITAIKTKMLVQFFVKKIAGNS
jgi:hypothetical protein